MIDPETELADYIAKCRAMHRSQVGHTPRFAHAVAALADKLDEAEQSRDLNHAAAKMALDQRDALLAQLAAAEQDARRLVKGIERGGYCLVEMLKAYERRIRSDCKTPEELEKRPWECIEYISAARYLQTMFSDQDAALSHRPPASGSERGTGEK